MKLRYVSEKRKKAKDDRISSEEDDEDATEEEQAETNVDDAIVNCKYDNTGLLTLGCLREGQKKPTAFETLVFLHRNLCRIVWFIVRKLLRFVIRDFKEANWTHFFLLVLLFK